MIVLGIDPGLGRTGWAILEKEPEPVLIAYGCIQTPPENSPDQRLLQIYRDLGKIIKKFSPQAVCIEKLFFNTNVATALAVGEARGVMRLCCVQKKLAILELTPLQIKVALTGYGRADKKQVQIMTQRLLGLTKCPQPDDAADAVAAALAYCYHKKELL